MLMGVLAHLLFLLLQAADNHAPPADNNARKTFAQNALMKHHKATGYNCLTEKTCEVSDYIPGRRRWRGWGLQGHSDPHNDLPWVR